MAVTYDKIGFTLIEKGLRDIINNDFQNVYISNSFNMVGNECIRINLENSNNIATSKKYEEREYSIMLRYYFNSKIVDNNVNKSIKDKADRLKKKLLDNRTNSTNWINLDVGLIEYDIQDDENTENDIYIIQYDLTLINHNAL